jgi:hypothetical protein
MRKTKAVSSVFCRPVLTGKDQYGSKKLLWLLKHKLHTAKYVNEETEFFFSRARMSIEALLKLLINKENDEYGEVKPL